MKALSAAKRKRSPHARRPRKGQAAANNTREVILAAARDVLFRAGYEQFTTRRVAEYAGIAVGNLSYHFPSKRELVSSVIERLLAEYTVAIEGFFADLSVPPDRMIKALVQWLLADAITSQTNRTFRELWAMALHDRFVARALGDLYNKGIAQIAGMLRRAEPGLSQGSANTIAHLLVSISEGAGVIYGLPRPRTANLSDVVALAVKVLTDAARPATNER